jgi:hypothetical protein
MWPAERSILALRSSLFVMPIVSSSTKRREVAIQTARRRIQRLEIETHRIKADLARLEAANEDDIADELVHGFRQDTRLVVDGRVARSEHPANGMAGTRGPRSAAMRGVSFDTASTDGSSGNHTRRGAQRVDLSGRPRQAKKSTPTPTPAIQIAAGAAKIGTRRPASRRWLKPAWTMSLGVHVALLLVGGLATYATLTQNEFLLHASANNLPEETFDEPSDIEIEPIATEELEPQDTFVDSPHFELGEHMMDSLIPAPDSGIVGAASNLGLVSGLPSDLGTLMAGGGEGEPGGGPVGSASFFGSQSKADRVVFLIDNSSSMKNGRLEAAVDELVRSVEAMSKRQSFYVIFVSDQPYPMFYPEPAAGLLPATAPNKKRLGEWLRGLRSAGGSNRKLTVAMDLAATLRPETVFFLWDGRIDHAGVRRDVMLYMTRPQPWNFTIHTLGMGVESLDSEQNLRAIAEAHGGTYLRVDIATRSKQ